MLPLSRHNAIQQGVWGGGRTFVRGPPCQWEGPGILSKWGQRESRDHDEEQIFKWLLAPLSCRVECFGDVSV